MPTDVKSVHLSASTQFLIGIVRNSVAILGLRHRPMCRLWLNQPRQSLHLQPEATLQCSRHTCPLRNFCSTTG